MAKVHEFLFDFGSPNAYMAWKALPGIEARTGVTIDPVPVLLGGIFKATGNVSPVIANANVPAKMAYMHLEMQRFVKKHGLAAFRMNPHFPVNTLMLMRAAVAAKAQGILPPYMAAAFHHMWEDPKKMDDPDVFVAAFDASGLDGAALLAATNDPAVKAGLIANTENAVARGVFGIPSYFVGTELYFGKDRLANLEEEILAQSGR